MGKEKILQNRFSFYDYILIYPGCNDCKSRMVIMDECQKNGGQKRWIPNRAPFGRLSGMTLGGCALRQNTLT